MDVSRQGAVFLDVGLGKDAEVMNPILRFAAALIQWEHWGWSPSHCHPVKFQRVKTSDEHSEILPEAVQPFEKDPYWYLWGRRVPFSALKVQYPKTVVYRPAWRIARTMRLGMLRNCTRPPSSLRLNARVRFYARRMDLGFPLQGISRVEEQGRH